MNPEVVYAIRELAAAIEKGCMVIANAMSDTGLDTPVEAKPQAQETPTKEPERTRTPAPKPIEPKPIDVKKLREQATPLITKVVTSKGLEVAKRILKRYANPNAEGQYKLTGVPDENINDLITELRETL